MLIEAILALGCVYGFIFSCGAGSRRSYPKEQRTLGVFRLFEEAQYACICLGGFFGGREAGDGLPIGGSGYFRGRGDHVGDVLMEGHLLDSV